MLTLRLLGGLSLHGPDGPITGRASQRRRLALLAILAVAGGRFVSRDKVIAWLWPESDAERARHLLADTVYVLRAELGDDVILTNGDDLALNTERLAADVVDFGRCLERDDPGERERAVKVYAAGGPFLDGIHITDSSEFERWADSTREQLALAYRGALERLAADASARRDHQAAVAWWRQLAAEDRLSSRVALDLMRALAAAGDRAGALEFARVHAAIVRAELDAAPDPALVEFTDQLRHGAEVAPLATSASPEVVVDLIAPESAPATANNPGAVASPPPPTPPVRRRWLDARRRPLRYGVGAIALAGILSVAALWGRLPEADPSIVVLPLANLSPGNDNESLADGMTDELIDQLARTGRLQVIASTSAFAFKRHRTDVRAIADSLHVAHVLEGDLQRAGERFRLRLRLVDARDGSTRWTETYNRPVQDMLAVEDDISRSVANELQARLVRGTARAVGPVRRRVPDPVAYDFFLRGRHARDLRSDTGFTAAIKDFKSAIAVDSSYAEAWAWLSETSVMHAVFGPTGVARTALEQADSAAHRALSLDDSLAEAHTALGIVRLNYRIDVRAAEGELRRALAIDPNDRHTHEFLALTYAWSGRPKDALAEAQRAVDLDPLSVTALRNLSWALLMDHQYDEALRQIERARSFGPPLRQAPVVAAEIYAAKGMYPEALAEIGQACCRLLYALAMKGHVLARAGREAEAKTILSDLTAQTRAGSPDAFDVAVVYAGLTDFRNACTWLARSLDDFSLRMEMIMLPNFEDLRGQPCFQPIRRSVGL